MAAPTVDNPRRKKSSGLAPTSGGGKTIKTSPLAKKRLRYIEKERETRALTDREKAIAKTMKGQMNAINAARSIAEKARQVSESRKPAMRTTSGGGGNSKRAM